MGADCTNFNDDNEASIARLNSLLHGLSDLLADKGSLLITLGNCFLSGDYIPRTKNDVFLIMWDFGRNAKLNQHLVVS